MASKYFWLSFVSLLFVSENHANDREKKKMKINTPDAIKDFSERRTNAYMESESFLISKAKAKSYEEESFIVQSSPEPIDLGKPMGPYMDLDSLRKFMKSHGIKKKEGSPKEVWLYNWTNGAQGKMVFQTGFVVDDSVVLPPGTSNFKIVKLPPMKFSSVYYEGPFPGKKNSGWQNIKWEDRAKEAGLRYNEVLYRELYHKYENADGERNLTEIEISID